MFPDSETSQNSSASSPSCLLARYPQACSLPGAVPDHSGSWHVWERAAWPGHCCADSAEDTGSTVWTPSFGCLLVACGSVLLLAWDSPQLISLMSLPVRLKSSVGMLRNGSSQSSGCITVREPVSLSALAREDLIHREVRWIHLER